MTTQIEGGWGTRIQDTAECAAMIRQFLDRIAEVDPCLNINSRWQYYINEELGGPDDMAVADDTLAGLTDLLDRSRIPDGGMETVMNILPPELGSHLHLYDNRERGLSLYVRCGGRQFRAAQENVLMLRFPDPRVIRDEERVFYDPETIDALLRIVIEVCAPYTAALYVSELYAAQLSSPHPNLGKRMKFEQQRQDSEVRLGWETFIAGNPTLHYDLLPDIATVEKTHGGTLIRLGDNPLNTEVSAILDLRLALGYPEKETAAT